MDWKSNFERPVLMQGWQLYQNRQVKQLTRDKDIFKAVVSDPWTGQDQLVQAQVENGNIVFLECTCPYSDNGHLCSHEAAFLFALEDFDSLDEVPQAGKTKPDNRNSRNPYSAHQTVHEFDPYRRPETQKRPSADWQVEDEPESGTPAKRKEEYSSESDYPSSAARSRLKERNQDRQDLYSYLQSLAEKSAGSEPSSTSSRTEKRSVQGVVAEEPIKRSGSGNEADRRPEPEQTAVKQPETVLSHPVKSEESPVQSSENRRQKKTSAYPGTGLADLIMRADEKKLREFVLSQARISPDFRQKLEIELLHQLPDDMMDSLYSKIDSLISLYQNAGGQISQKNADQMIEKLSDLLNSYIRLFAEKEEYSAALSLLSYAAGALMDYPLDLNEKQTETLLALFERLTSRVLERADDETRDEAYSWIELSLQKKNLSAAVKKELISVLNRYFRDEKYSRRIYEILIKVLDAENQAVRNNHFEAAVRDQILQETYGILKRTPSLKEEKAAFEQTYRNNSAVLDLEAEEAVKLGESQLAAELLKQKIYTLPADSMETAVTLRKLAGLYKQNGNKEKAGNVLRHLAASNRHLILDDLLKLQKYCDENEFRAILNSISLSSNPLTLAEAYAKTGMEEELMAMIEQRQDSLLLEQYQELLQERFASRIAGFWLREAENLPEKPDSRDYDHVVHALKMASELPGTEEKVHQTAETLRTKYGRRHGLLHRLDEAGF